MLKIRVLASQARVLLTLWCEVAPMAFVKEPNVRTFEDPGTRPRRLAGPVQRIGKNGDYIILQIDRFFTLEEVWRNLVMVLKPYLVSDKAEGG